MTRKELLRALSQLEAMAEHVSNNSAFHVEACQALYEIVEKHFE